MKTLNTQQLIEFDKQQQQIEQQQLALQKEQDEQEEKHKNLFKGLKFFLNREVEKKKIFNLHLIFFDLRSNLNSTFDLHF